MDSYFYVIAGNVTQAKDYAKKNNVKWEQFRYIDNVRRLNGLANITVHMTGNYYLNWSTRDLDALNVYALAHNITLIKD